MALYEWNDDKEMGIPVIDAAHRRIADLANRLDALAEAGDERDLRQCYDELRDAILSHFLDEEKVLDTLGTAPHVVSHVTRHKANHEAIRNLFEYADMKIAEGGNIRVILPKLPAKYFDELAEADEEMRILVEAGGAVTSSSEKV